MSGCRKEDRGQGNRYDDGDDNRATFIITIDRMALRSPPLHSLSPHRSGDRASSNREISSSDPPSLPPRPSHGPPL